MITKLEMAKNWIVILNDKGERISFGREPFYSDLCYKCQACGATSSNFAPWVVPNEGWLCDNCVIKRDLLSKEDVVLVRTLNKLDEK